MMGKPSDKYLKAWVETKVFGLTIGTAHGHK